MEIRKGNQMTALRFQTETSGISDIPFGAKNKKKQLDRYSKKSTTYKYIKNIVPAKRTGVSDST